MRDSLLLASCVLVAVALFGFSRHSGDAPEGWFLTGSAPAAYEVGVERDADRAGTVAYLAATAPSPEGFGTLMQITRADDFRGQRLRMTAHVRTEDVANWAGLWMRVDGAGRPAPQLAFDNMQGRPIEGTTAWQPYKIVLDVPEAADAVAFGVLLDGPGRVWLDDVAFDEVDESVPATGRAFPADPPYPDHPTNLDFEQ